MARSVLTTTRSNETPCAAQMSLCSTTINIYELA